MQLWSSNWRLQCILGHTKLFIIKVISVYLIYFLEVMHHWKLLLKLMRNHSWAFKLMSVKLFGQIRLILLSNKSLNINWVGLLACILLLQMCHMCICMCDSHLIHVWCFRCIIHVIHVWCFRCIIHVIHTPIIHLNHMYRTTCVIYVCIIHVYCMCWTCVLHMYMLHM